MLLQALFKSADHCAVSTTDRGAAQCNSCMLRGKAEATVARADRQKGGIKGAAQAAKAKVLEKQAQAAHAAAKLVSAVLVLNTYCYLCCSCMHRLTLYDGVSAVCCL